MVENKNNGSNNHRGNFDIIADILDASYGGVKKTYLMYRCNLSFKQLKSYSHFLLTSGLLHVVEEKEIQSNNIGLFEITDKGKAFLRAYKGLRALIE